MERDSDRLAVWDARARSLLGRIDEALTQTTGAEAQHETEAAPADTRVEAERLERERLARRLRIRTPPPAGRVLHPDAPNMGPQPYRLDHWDAFVCRFEDDGDAAASA